MNEKLFETAEPSVHYRHSRSRCFYISRSPDIISRDPSFFSVQCGYINGNEWLLELSQGQLQHPVCVTTRHLHILNLNHSISLPRKVRCDEFAISYSILNFYPYLPNTTYPGKGYTNEARRGTCSIDISTTFMWSALVFILTECFAVLCIHCHQCWSQSWDK